MTLVDNTSYDIPLKKALTYIFDNFQLEKSKETVADNNVLVGIWQQLVSIGTCYSNDLTNEFSHMFSCETLKRCSCPFSVVLLFTYTTIKVTDAAQHQNSYGRKGDIFPNHIWYYWQQPFSTHSSGFDRWFYQFHIKKSSSATIFENHANISSGPV